MRLSCLYFQLLLPFVHGATNLERNSLLSLERAEIFSAEDSPHRGNSWSLSDVDGFDWRLSDKSGTYKNIKAAVPGNAHLALMEAGLLTAIFIGSTRSS